MCFFEGEDGVIVAGVVVVLVDSVCEQSGYVGRMVAKMGVVGVNPSPLGEVSQQSVSAVMPECAPISWNLAQLLVPHTTESSNTYTGLRNIGNTCFVNVALQTFLHVAGLRRWTQEPRLYARDVFQQLELLK